MANCVANFCKENELTADKFNDKTNSVHSTTKINVSFLLWAFTDRESILISFHLLWCCLVL